MNKQNKKKVLTLLNGIYDALYRCICYTTYFEKVTCSIEKQKNHFLIIVQNTLGDEACIYWTHIFGKNDKNNHLHYEIFFNLIDEEEFKVNDIKKRILNVIEFDENEYSDFFNNIIKARNKTLAHKDIDISDNSIFYPDLIICRKMAQELLVILLELINKWISVEYEEIFDKEDMSILLSYKLLSPSIKGLDAKCHYNYELIINF